MTPAEMPQLLLAAGMPERSLETIGIASPPRCTATGSTFWPTTFRSRLLQTARTHLLPVVSLSMAKPERQQNLRMLSCGSMRPQTLLPVLAQPPHKVEGPPAAEAAIMPASIAFA